MKKGDLSNQWQAHFKEMMIYLIMNEYCNEGNVDLSHKWGPW